MRTSEIRIDSPCGADWRTMKRADQKRFCDACKKHVHDLSAMNADEARALLASKPTEGLCVRYLYDAHGEIVFRDAPIPAAFLSRAKRLLAAAAVPLGLAACGGGMHGEPVPMMGAVAPMPESHSPVVPEVPPAPSASSPVAPSEPSAAAPTDAAPASSASSTHAKPVTR